MGLLSKISIGKKAKPNQGHFVVLEGIDGSGKHTQLELLAESLVQAGYSIATVSFPRYGEPSAYFLEKIVDQHWTSLTPQGTAISYAVDRIDAKEAIEKELSAGKIVLADRYSASNAAHQGSRFKTLSERIAFYRWVYKLEFDWLGLPKPDLTIILDIDATSSSKRIEGRSKVEKRKSKDPSLTHLEGARKAYRELAPLWPNMKVVSVTEATKQQVHNKVWELVRRLALRELTA